jgi:hypothetical protein
MTVDEINDYIVSMLPGDMSHPVLRTKPDIHHM